MLDPTINVRKRYTGQASQRTGAIAVLFAILLPVLLIFVGFAINMAYMQLVSTELKVASDAASHAGGRAMSIHQTTDDAIAQAELTIQSNLVGGRVLTVGTGDDGEEDQIEVIFGKSVRGDNGFGMYVFNEVPKGEVDSGAKRATSVGVISNIQLPMVFNAMSNSSFHPARRSVATQVDRDIALVLDRSGSMLYYRDETALADTLLDLYNTWDTTEEPGHYKFYYWRWTGSSWQGKGYYKESDANPSWYKDDRYYYWVDGDSSTERRISSSEYNDATDSLYERTYSNNVIFQLERWTNADHTLGSSYSSSENGDLTDQMAKYCQDWKYASGAPRYSRWYYLDQGVTAFLDILEITDQEELVSLVTFSYSATLDINLTDTYDDVRSFVSGINPDGGTAIGDGMTTGLPPIVSGEAARPFAAKTIVVLTDGENNNGQDPNDAVDEIMAEHAVTIHTVTFTNGADQDAMTTVATKGQGRHYHADDGDALVDIFEEIANNLPTILTE